MSLEADQRALWEEVRVVIGGHIESGHDEVDTINRLLRKNPWLRDRGERLQIPRRGLEVSSEEWPLSKLWPLLHSSHITEQPPGRPKGAVIVLRSHGHELLIDGRRRINFWHREGISGPHRVLVIHEERQ